MEDIEDNIQIGIVENDEYFLAEVQERLKSLSCSKSVHTWVRAEKLLETIQQIDLVAQLTNDYPNLKVIMLTNMNSDEMIFNSIKNGALGYILKSDIGRLK